MTLGLAAIDRVGLGPERGRAQVKRLVGDELHVASLDRLDRRLYERLGSRCRLPNASATRL